MNKNHIAYTGQNPSIDAVSELVEISLAHIREHNLKVNKLIGSFELLRTIEEKQLSITDEGTLGELPDHILKNIRKSQQDIWMYTGIIEDLSALQLIVEMSELRKAGVV